MLPDMPFDVLYDVSRRTISTANDPGALTYSMPTDILSRPPDGSAANVVDQQDLS